MKRLLILLLINLILIFTGCSLINDHDEEVVYETNNPDAEEVLALEPNANIFQYDNIIYKTHIDWVDELDVTKDEQIGAIKEINKEETNFKNEMSNNLPVGAKIFSAKERGDVLIVEYEDITLKYLAIVEG